MCHKNCKLPHLALCRLKKWADGNLMKSSKVKRSVLHLQSSSPDADAYVSTRCRPAGWRTAFLRQTLGSWGQQADQKPAPCPCGTTRLTGSWDASGGALPVVEEGGVLLVCSPLVRPHPGLCGTRGRFQCSATKVIKDLGSLLYRGTLRELGAFSLEKARLKGDLTSVCGTECR